jgi:hypothetical protein
VRFERCEFLPVDDGPYTWNRIRYPVPPDAYSWMREWPESSGSAPPRFEKAVSPQGTRDFQASERPCTEAQFNYDVDSTAWRK